MEPRIQHPKPTVRRHVPDRLRFYRSLSLFVVVVGSLALINWATGGPWLVQWVAVIWGGVVIWRFLSTFVLPNVSGPEAAPPFYDPQANRAIDEFLREGESGTAATNLHHGTAVILFADIVDSTALTERLGDATFRDKARDLDAALRTVIRNHAGTPIEGKLLGDGVLAVFTSARQAIEAALACGTSGASAGLPLHLGLHAGDVIREENNVYGGAVNIASRIAGLSAAGEVLVSETVRSLARTSAGARFEDRGEQALKGVGEAVRVWAVVEEPE
jgi:class 3 adenylate cyclase